MSPRPSRESWVSVRKPFDRRSWPLPTVNVSHWRMPVQPGEIDEAACHAYSWGQCHSLAIALSEATQWPIVELCDLPRFGPDSMRSIIHMLVQRPDGMLLDITGARSRAELDEVYPLAVVRELDGRAARRLDRNDHGWGAPMLPINLSVARSFTAPLLALAS